MKMITAIVNRKDTNEVCRALKDAGIYFTRMATTGGFLTAGNTTLMIGIEDERVEQALDIIRSHCLRRTETVPTTVQSTETSVIYPTEVTVGGATIFVTDVEQFEKV